MNTPCVIDLYHGDIVTDFKAVAGAGIKGVIHKAYEAGVIDSMYARRRQAFVHAGLYWGAYCFFHGSDKGNDPIVEADRFLSAANPDANTLVALDWERDEDGYVPSADDARKFCQRIEEKLGRKCVIYSGDVAKEQIKGKDTYFGAHRLWLAQYGSSWTVQLSWDIPWLWQNNGDRSGPGPHRIAGIEGYCDNSTIVTGTVDDLIAEWAT